MHGGFLTVNGEKMSKSLGNFVTIRDFLKNHSARILRFFVLKAHYRSPIDYSENLIDQTKKELQRIDEFVEKLRKVSPLRNSKRRDLLTPLLTPFKTRFQSAMENDFNTPEALAVLFELIKQGNVLQAQNALGKKDAKDILSFLKQADKIFGFIFWGKEAEKIPAEITKLAKMRKEYREKNNWQEADKLRAQIETNGWTIEDTPAGQKLKKKTRAGL